MDNKKTSIKIMIDNEALEECVKGNHGLRHHKLAHVIEKMAQELLDLRKFKKECAAKEWLKYPENKPKENKGYLCKCKVTDGDSIIINEVCYFESAENINWLDSYGNPAEVIEFSEINA